MKKENTNFPISKTKKAITCICIAIALVTLSVLVYSLFAGGNNSETLAASSFRITGDVENEIIIENFEGYEIREVVNEEETYNAISLVELLEKANPLGSEVSIFIAAPDGVMAEIKIEEVAEDSLVYFSRENAWSFNSPSHPVQSGIKGINNIVVVANNPTEETPGINLISSSGDFAEESGYDKFISCGELFTMDKVKKVILEGEPLKDGIMTNAYSTREMIEISTLFEGNIDSAVGYFGDGSEETVEKNGYILWRGNTIDYIAPDGRGIKNDIIGIWAGAPELSVTDVRSRVEAEAADVLIIEIDGLGINTLTEFQPEFIFSKGYEQMRTVMPSVSNVALASIVTGETPDVTGITSRDEREPLVGDMFEGRNAAVIEGYGQLISMSVDQDLNPDLNDDGSTDDDVFAAAQDAIAMDYEILYVHFHGFDDSSHNYGPFSDEARDKLYELDGYIKSLSEDFNGKIIIVSDHGQHDVNEDGRLGNHGNFYYSDMLVPFIEYDN